MNPERALTPEDLIACQAAAQTGKSTEMLQTGQIPAGARIAAFGTGEPLPAHEPLAMPAQVVGAVRTEVANVATETGDVINFMTAREAMKAQNTAFVERGPVSVGGSPVILFDRKAAAAAAAEHEKLLQGLHDYR